jgi:hypothetical protein
MADVTLPVQSTSPGGTGTSTFNYGNVPIVFNLTPNHGFAGTLIEINGENFLSSGIVSVTFAGISVSFVVVNDGQILITAPPPPVPGNFPWPVVITTLSGATGRPVKPFTYDVVFAYWDPPTAKNVTLGPVLAFPNLKVTNNVTDINIADVGAQVVHLLAQNSGKYYYEITADYFPAGAFDGGICIAPPLLAYDVLGSPGAGGFNPNGTDGAGGVMLEGDGAIFSNGSQVCSLLGISTGDVIGVAVDFDNRLVWFKVIAGPDQDGTSDWNGGQNGNGVSPGIGAGSNPLTGVLGLSLPSGAMVPYMIFGGDNVADVFSANFGQNIFVINQALVTGFNDWPGN